MIAQNPKYGITGALSLTEENDKTEVEKLEKYLSEQAIYETESELIQRERILGIISHLFNVFVKNVLSSKKLIGNSENVRKNNKCKNYNRSESSISYNYSYQDTYGKIFTFGSYRLGVHTRGADIDTLCVAPKHIERKEFFAIFGNILEEEGFVVEKVEGAYVPVMQIRCSGKNDLRGKRVRIDMDNFDEKSDSKETLSDFRSDKINHNENYQKITSNKDLSGSNNSFKISTPSKNTLSDTTNQYTESKNSKHDFFIKYCDVSNKQSNFSIPNNNCIKINKIDNYEMNKEQIDTKNVQIKKDYENQQYPIEQNGETQNSNESDSNKTNNNERNNKNQKLEIKIDLVFASLNISRINASLDLSDSTLLKNLDEKSVLSLNGNRVADDVLNLVPNIKVFHGALRCIKYWSQRRQINGHAFGYFGGIAYAITVARICQLFPHFDEFNIIKKYFELYKDWKWPIPVMLRKIENLNYNFKVWDPKSNPSDKFHRMPVITPSYPSMCATHNIFNSTMKRYKDELERGYSLLNQKYVNWNEFFRQTDFFQKHRSFLVCFVINKGTNRENGEKYSEKLAHFKMWQGHINSKLRFLCTKLEMIEQCEAAPPFPQSFDLSSFINKFTIDTDLKDLKNIFSKNDFCSLSFIGLEFSESKELVKKKVFLDEPISEFKQIVYDWEKKDGHEEFVLKVLKRKTVNLLLKKIHEMEKMME